MQPSENYINVLSKLENILGNAGNDFYTWYYDNIGVATLGYGHALVDAEGQHIRRGEPNATARASAATELLTGSRVGFSRADACALKLKDLSAFAAHVNPLLRADTSQEAYDALLDFAYNVGAGALQSSTLLRMHNSGQAIVKPYDLTHIRDNSRNKGPITSIGDAFAAWSNADHIWSLGVFHRRAFEFLVYTGMDYQQAYTSAWAVMAH